ncbi:hypothetical protein D3C87_1689420 [compost metagenome]
MVSYLETDGSFIGVLHFFAFITLKDQETGEILFIGLYSSFNNVQTIEFGSKGIGNGHSVSQLLFLNPFGTGSSIAPLNYLYLRIIVKEIYTLP